MPPDLEPKKIDTDKLRAESEESIERLHNLVGELKTVQEHENLILNGVPPPPYKPLPA